MVGAAEFTHQGLGLVAEPLSEAHGPIRLVWLHGWGQNRQSLRSLANALLPRGEAWLLDLPGHGQAAVPQAACAPAQMAELLAAWLGTLPPCPTYLVGHSMGFRVALHAAWQQTLPMAGIVALAGAGVPRRLPWRQRVRRALIRSAMGLGHRLKPWVGERLLQALRRRFGSRDYLACPAALRPMFMAVVQDDASPFLPHLTVPALLLYGAEDEETPPNVGQTMARLLPHAACVVLPHLNHHTILTHGQHVVAEKLRAWLPQRP